MKRKQRIISLGKLAIKMQTTKSKLEYYETIGLIKPLYKMVDGVRCYDYDRSVNRIALVQEYQEKGMMLQEIKNKFKK